MKIRNENLPCGHRFVYVDVMLGKNIIRCTTCNWTKEIEGRPARKTDLTYEKFRERVEAEK